MNSQSHFKETLIFVFFILLMLFSFSARIGDGWYYFNDGVTIACSLESVSDLLHPGKWEVHGCTFDHQPLYQILVKLIGGSLGYDLYLYQWLNVFFYVFAWFYFTQRIAQKRNLYVTSAVTFFILSSFDLLHWIQEIRMYALYGLSCFYVIAEMENLEEEISWKKLSLHLLFYLNFYAYVFPLVFYIFHRFRRNGLREQRLLGFSFIMLFLLVIKTPFVVWWRFSRRQGGEQIKADEVLRLLGERLIHGTPIYEKLGWTLAALAIIWALIKFPKGPIKWTYFSFLILPVAALVIGTSVLKIHEIELRYFLFLYPVITLFIIQLLDAIKVKALKYVLASGLVFLGAYNGRLQPIWGELDGGEIKRSAEFLGQNGWKNNVIYTDTIYFFYAYVGIYSQILTSYKPRIELLPDKIHEKSVFASVGLSMDEHQELLRKKGIKFQTIWREDNFLKWSTVISELFPENENQDGR
jgi:hypothetical protein